MGRSIEGERRGMRCQHLVRACSDCGIRYSEIAHASGLTEQAIGNYAREGRAAYEWAYDSLVIGVRKLYERRRRDVERLGKLLVEFGVYDGEVC